jgi:hypothetical protein
LISRTSRTETDLVEMVARTPRLQVEPLRNRILLRSAM